MAGNIYSDSFFILQGNTYPEHGASISAADDIHLSPQKIDAFLDTENAEGIRFVYIFFPDADSIVTDHQLHLAARDLQHNLCPGGLSMTGNIRKTLLADAEECR